MQGFQRLMLVGAASLLACVQTQAAVFTLAEYAFNMDGTVTNGSSPGGVNSAGFDSAIGTGTGLGSISVVVSGAGSHYLSLFIDHEIDEAANTFYNERGSSSGSKAIGQSWEIDEPGHGSTSMGTAGTLYTGDIYANLQARGLDGQIFFDAVGGQSLLSPDDVSMALAWNFSLAAGETATIDFLLSETSTISGFYLIQTDPDSQASINFSSRLTIQPAGQQVPEPASWALMGAALLGLAQSRRKPAATSAAR
jgi:hypothetical protein